MTRRINGHTKSGKPIDDELADEAEAGYDEDQVIARRSIIVWCSRWFVGDG